MADYTWFKLLVRAIGLVLIGFAAPDLVMVLGWIIATISTEGTSDISYAAAMWSANILGSLSQLIFGLYLFFGGQWIIERSLRGVYGHCPSCSYDLKGHAAPNCPECGALLPGRAATPTTPPPSLPLNPPT